MIKKFLQNRSRRPGFTLIELLIVIMIIAILSLVAVSSYAGVQRQAAVDFAADTLVSAFREAQDFARSGRVERTEGGAQAGSSATPAGTLAPTQAARSLCFAVKIVSGTGEEGGLYVAETPYISVEGDIVDSCTMLDAGGAGDGGGSGVGEAGSSGVLPGWRKSDVFGGRIVIFSAGRAGQATPEMHAEDTSQEAQALTFYFKPPFGKVFVEEAGALQPAIGGWTMMVGDSERTEWTREVVFDSSTGEVKRRSDS